jgi:Zn-dependent protease with chaperone function
MTSLWLACLVLVAVHFLVSLALSVVALLALPFLEPRLRLCPAGVRAAAALALALSPAVGGMVAALGVALPAWLRHEAGGGTERPGSALVALAAAGLALGALRLGGALRDHRRTSRLAARWIRAGRDLSGLPLPATRVPCDFPLAVVFGLWRPRLLLSDRLLRALSRAQTRAVVEHELAHAAMRDNLRLFLLRASPDLLALLPAGRRLRSVFGEASEAAADERASARVSPLLLARALLKTASLVPPGQRLDLALAALHREGGIAARVLALLREGAPREAAPGRPWTAAPFIVLGLAVLVVVVLAAGTEMGSLVHQMLERLVHLSA